MGNDVSSSAVDGGSLPRGAPNSFGKQRRKDLEVIPLARWSVSDVVEWLNLSSEETDDQEYMAWLECVQRVAELQVDGQGLILLGLRFFCAVPGFEEELEAARRRREARRRGESVPPPHLRGRYTCAMVLRGRMARLLSRHHREVQQIHHDFISTRRRQLAIAACGDARVRVRVSRELLHGGSVSPRAMMSSPTTTTTAATPPKHRTNGGKETKRSASSQALSVPRREKPIRRRLEDVMNRWVGSPPSNQKSIPQSGSSLDSAIDFRTRNASSKISRARSTSAIGATSISPPPPRGGGGEDVEKAEDVEKQEERRRATLHRAITSPHPIDHMKRSGASAKRRPNGDGDGDGNGDGNGNGISAPKDAERILAELNAIHAMPRPRHHFAPRPQCPMDPCDAVRWFTRATAITRRLHQPPQRLHHKQRDGHSAPANSSSTAMLRVLPSVESCRPHPFRRYYGADYYLLYKPPQWPLMDGSSSASSTASTMARCDDVEEWRPYALLDGSCGRRSASWDHEALGRFLSLSFGVAGDALQLCRRHQEEDKGSSSSPWSLASARGVLHAIECYAVLPPSMDPSKWSAHGPATYHYSPKEHGLELRRHVSIDVWNALGECWEGHKDTEDASKAGVAGPHFYLVLSYVAWREVWRCGERGLRLAMLGCGAAVASVGAAADAMGWLARAACACHSGGGDGAGGDGRGGDTGVAGWEEGLFPLSALNVLARLRGREWADTPSTEMEECAMVIRVDVSPSMAGPSHFSSASSSSSSKARLLDALDEIHRMEEEASEHSTLPRGRPNGLSITHDRWESLPVMHAVLRGSTRPNGVERRKAPHVDKGSKYVDNDSKCVDNDSKCVDNDSKCVDNESKCVESGAGPCAAAVLERARGPHNASMEFATRVPMHVYMSMVEKICPPRWSCGLEDVFGSFRCCIGTYAIRIEGLSPGLYCTPLMERDRVHAGGDGETQHMQESDQMDALWRAFPGMERLFLDEPAPSIPPYHPEDDEGGAGGVSNERVEHGVFSTWKSCAPSRGSASMGAVTSSASSAPPVYAIRRGCEEEHVAKWLLEEAVGQREVTDGAFAIEVFADLSHALAIGGPIAYRQLHYMAGIIGHVIRMEAESHGLNAVCLERFADDGLNGCWEASETCEFTPFYLCVVG